MSFISFFDKVGSELKKLFGSTTWEKQAQGVITYVAPLLETVLALADPPLAPLFQKVINTIQADLATVSAVVSGAQVPAGSTTAATVKAALGSIQTNLSSLLADADVKNSTKATEITAAVTGITSEIDALASSMPAAIAA